ncbi:hypothetical protein [Beggiatoa leptomitoformis]|uniref:Uncharacterized protein n=1 Tax=Beggiatoa leptomitoformis TaxID=288004 RepID=A0A2N9YBW9_9GAMM|nr:hypothetical protein [Beggiatoa leptomitoformis]ALG66762.1 hypothetical protein AL038_02340 [Beggiatoa leptomitoformis]AUI67894.1 hypothetical protein BLE401_03700 [Beggiatoa leptomitoformis]
MQQQPVLTEKASALCNRLQQTPQELTKQGLLKRLGVTPHYRVTLLGSQTLKQLKQRNMSITKSDVSTSEQKCLDNTLTEPEHQCLEELQACDTDIQILIDAGFLEEKNGRLYPTEEGFQRFGGV